jgi:hypothetical protein
MNDARTRSYGADVNFHASSKAREDAAAFMRVKRAQWIGELVGEEPKPGLITWSGKSRGPKPLKEGEVEKPIFWNELALHEQRRIIAGLKSVKSASSGTAAVAATEPVATGKVTIDDKGVITIPSAACSSPTESTKALYRGGHTDLIVFLKDKAGNTVLHLSRYSKESDTFEYTFDAPKAGKYQLVASVVTPKWDQRLFATANGGTPVEMALPYTIGMWDKTAPVAIELKAGQERPQIPRARQGDAGPVHPDTGAPCHLRQRHGPAARQADCHLGLGRARSRRVGATRGSDKADAKAARTKAAGK